MRRIVTTLLALILGLTLTPLSAPTASATTGPCTAVTLWGSLAKGALPVEPALSPLVGLRAGRHDCFDRLVLDIDGEPGEYSVRYVNTVSSPFSGEVVPLRGGARLEVVVGHPAYDPESGEPTLVLPNPSEAVDVSGYPTLRQVAAVASFEGETTVGVGVRARLPFRVFTLPAGEDERGHIVIDVAHSW